MIRIDRLFLSPVKSLALAEVSRAYLDKPGIAGDRAFFIVDAAGKLFTQRDYGPLVQVHASYETTSGRLDLAFPDGRVLNAVPEAGEPMTAAFWGERPVEGRVVCGEWNDALSEFAGQDLRLVKAAKPGASFDGFPLSMCSTASLEALAEAAGEETVDGRR
ncbi:MAG: MOSC N-terminal beta barrel domain-containing protein, partial [Dehalococcoidia bacterium]|nr:MOSC N-terminal beta barrel domain-containing protein [Dehalococcoidia bacterium]